jgi:DNA-binding transcriptional regulator PaaX
MVKYRIGESRAVKAVKAAPATGSNGTPAPTLSARVKRMPAKVLKNLAALGEPHRLAVLGFVAAAAGPVTLADVAGRLGGGNTGETSAMGAVDQLKRHGWLASDRVPKASGGGWRYRLSDAGRERLMALGG